MMIKSLQILPVCAFLFVMAVLPPLAQADQPPGHKVPMIEVAAVEQRSACDTPAEWFIQVTNLSDTYYRVRVEATVLASLHSDPRCTETAERTFDLAPDQCGSIQKPFFNGPPRPCDLPCCDRSNPDCNICTVIQHATVEILAESRDGIKWNPKSSVHCVILNGEVVEGYPKYCRVVNSCETGQTLNACSY
ncbi:MAG: hypothetical protein OEX18_01390 [Candidatus Krumholzibacteria bacterium]|nr:hypothetical protein [Candidatus Krumholzibacteria bacterium]MDH4335916.1 hypothetical protein [Candidatus Krumholzibacteria bacterium]MDH5268508.1 hypothetical protein [Candidatus Krumholzibacteria bacterium]